MIKDMKSVKVLIITQDYFVVPELLRAFEELGVSVVTVFFRQEASFLKEMFDYIASFLPHFILTVNHAGLDRDGQVLELLRKVRVPLASWFVDRPESFLQQSVADDVMLGVFSWDPNAIDFLRGKNIVRTCYLPLGTDPNVFYCRKPTANINYTVSFVGSSWTDKIEDIIHAGDFPAKLIKDYKQYASKIINCSCIPMQELFYRLATEVQEELGLVSNHQKQMYLRLIQMEATRMKRVYAVSELLPFKPLVVGDEHWKSFLTPFKKSFDWCGRIDYEKELPEIFLGSSINFNQSSLQSAGALNQRVFDVPACNSFLLTDYYSSLEDLFEPGKEVACYKDIEEVDELINFYMGDQKLREQISAAGMKRVLAEHTYKSRVTKIVDKMSRWF